MPGCICNVMPLDHAPIQSDMDQTVDAVFAAEQAELRPLGRPFDGYVEKAVRVRSTFQFLGSEPPASSRSASAKF